MPKMFKIAPNKKMADEFRKQWTPYFSPSLQEISWAGCMPQPSLKAAKKAHADCIRFWTEKAAWLDSPEGKKFRAYHRKHGLRGEAKWVLWTGAEMMAEINKGLKRYKIYEYNVPRFHPDWSKKS